MKYLYTFIVNTSINKYYKESNKMFSCRNKLIRMKKNAEACETINCDLTENNDRRGS